MAVPEFTSFFLPVLKITATQDQTTNAQMRDYCADVLKLTQEDISELLDSGRQTRFANRVQWAKTYLQKAGLIASPNRGTAVITEEGKRFLKQHSKGFTIKDLESFASFRNFSGSRPRKKEKKALPEINLLTPPNEQIENIIHSESEILATELLDEIKKAGSKAFEQLVLDVIREMGYGIDGRTTQYVKDGGIDGVIKEDRLGLSEIYLQAKLWDHNVGGPDIQQFIGALATRKAQKGIFITNGDFTQEAVNNAAKSPLKVVLINGQDLVKYMIQYGVGTQVYQTYELKKIDHDYFESIS
ncbi:MAG: restriction endonuclease [Lentisphaeria bacterium]|nr:restriction endonuclease [Lentisphaeria bacterium]